MFLSAPKWRVICCQLSQAMGLGDRLAAFAPANQNRIPQYIILFFPSIATSIEILHWVVGASRFHCVVPFWVREQDPLYAEYLRIFASWRLGLYH